MSVGEPKKEEFQRYLEKSGVIDAMTKVLVGLYEVPEKPTNAIDFIKEYLGASLSADHAALKATIDSQAKVIEEKEKEIQQLKKQLEALSVNNQQWVGGVVCGSLDETRRAACNCADVLMETETEVMHLLGFECMYV